MESCEILTRWGLALSILLYVGGCGPASASPPGARTPQGINVPCVTGLEGENKTIILDALDRAGDVSKSPAYRTTVGWVFSTPDALDRRSDPYPAAHRYQPDYILKNIDTSFNSPISVLGRRALFRATTGWDGETTLKCGRVVHFSVTRIADRGSALAAGTFHHELAHALGYRHAGNDRSENECTVPYVLGDLAEWAAVRGTGEIAEWPPNPVICVAVRDAINRWYKENPESLVLDWKETTFRECAEGSCHEAE